MMQDISNNLERALVARAAGALGRSALETLVADVPGARLDWDEDAGESWARVLQDGNVVAYLWARGPLGFVHTAASKIVLRLRSKGLDVIVLEDLAKDSLSAPRDLVERLAGRSVSEVLDHQGFSAEDLAWATL
ncbi:MAG: hypothetical protein R3F14_33420 [Polyangiaceae bacterium]